MLEGVKIRPDTIEESTWDGTEFTVCSRCKQVVRTEEIERKIHVCLTSKELISVAILS